MWEALKGLNEWYNQILVFKKNLNGKTGCSWKQPVTGKTIG